MANIEHISNQEYTLREIFNSLYHKKFFLLAMLVVGFFLGLSVSSFLPNIYKSQSILMPNEQDEPNITNTLNQYSGLANLAGFNMPQQRTSQAILAMEIITSKDFFQDFLDDEALINLFALKSWNIETKQKHYDESIYDYKNDKWVRDVRQPFKKKPSTIEAYEKFNEEVLDIYQDDTSGLVHLSISHISPEIAKQWADKIIFMINEKLRLRDIEEAENSINFLNLEMNKTELNELRFVLSQLIQKEISKISLANAKKEYVFTIVDPPHLPEFISSPNRVLITALTAIILLLSGFMYVLFFRFRSLNS